MKKKKEIAKNVAKITTFINQQINEKKKFYFFGKCI